MCPPKPESLIDAIKKLQKDIQKETIVERKNFVNKHISPLKESCGLLIENDLCITKLGVN
jgi:NADH:ubiquinone oxidoreductase subunit B-like Fe-S oxidoreductase